MAIKNQVRAVVIGGGVVGASILYHLTKYKGFEDSILLERTELTAGSTWHAAGLLPLFNMSYTVGKIHKHTIDLYNSLEEETGQEVSFRQTGNLRLATNQDRMDEYKKYVGTANTLGVPFELITPSEVKKLWPLAEVDDLVGALYHPTDGHVAPVDVTQALAKGARNRGGTIHLHTEVVDIKQKENGEWEIFYKTRDGEEGTIVCEHVISATGNYARQTAAMVGQRIPVIPVEHQYIVTDEVPELVQYREQGNIELPVLRESDAQYYLREERRGYILGPYEKGAPARFAEGVPETFGQELLPGDLERLMPHVEAAMKRVPSFSSAGIKDIVNGPIAYTPDGNPVVGEAYGLKNFWFAEGFSFGVTAAGGVGHYLSELITQGDTDLDFNPISPLRFGNYAGRNYSIVKNEECYDHVFVTHFEDEERPAGRPLKTTPVYDKLKMMGACFGARYGWERPNWFAPKGVEPKDINSFRRTNYRPYIAQECLAMRDSAGLMDLSGFTKFEITGDKSHEWLDSVVASKVPIKNGRSSLAYILDETGGVKHEWTITKIVDNYYYIVSGAGMEKIDEDFIKRNIPTDGSATYKNVTTQYGVFVLAGPNSRKILEKITNSDVSNNAFKWLTQQTIEVGYAPDVRAMRVNFIGELGWELHHPIEYQNHIFDKIWEAGQEFDLRLVGIRAMESMRIEKSYRMPGHELTREYSALEAGLDRFIDMNKDFVGKKALQKQQTDGLKKKIVQMEVFGLQDRDTGPNEPIFDGEKLVGRAASGAYGHRTDRAFSMCYLESKYANIGTELEMEILGDKFKAIVIEESPYDPKNERLRG